MQPKELIETGKNFSVFVILLVGLTLSFTTVSSTWNSKHRLHILKEKYNHIIQERSASNNQNNDEDSEGKLSFELFRYRRDLTEGGENQNAVEGCRCPPGPRGPRGPKGISVSQSVAFFLF